MKQTKLIRGWLNISSITGLSRYKLAELIATNKFPPPQRLGYRTIVWTCAEIATWVENLQRGESNE